MTSQNFLVVAVASMVALPGCFDFDDDRRDPNFGLRCNPASCEVREQVFIDPEGSHYQFVIDSVTLASTPAEATQSALDLDCSEPMRPDNVLGQLLATIASQLSVDINGVTAELIASGQLIHLIDVQTLDLDTSNNVGVQMSIGIDSDGDPSDNFSGSERFTVDDNFPSEPMAGHVISGNLEADLGRVPLQVSIPGSEEVFTMELDATMMKGFVNAERFSVILAGSLSTEQVQTGFLPATHIGIASIIEEDCQDGVCIPDSRGELLVNYFDSDEDRVVTLDEFLNHGLVLALTAPDLDVFDESGAVNPSCEGIVEGLSVGIALTGVPAQIESGQPSPRPL